MKKTLLTILAVIWAASATAHSPLETTIPENGATIADAPAEIVMNFKGNIRLTRVKMSHPAAETDLDLGGHDGFVTDYAIPMQSMGEGTYEIEWRGLGEDGHPMNGTFGFTVEK